ncbi:hypothetical protein [Pseudomonas oryzihabitans]|uniref:hypothetical protein n=1 Tax=Pseudomonas oryzihabitans TaxID=47885 RepID=UPI0011A32A22|nr:hypothetical protein [Pseudomonas psychrotolerans]
MSRDKWLNIPLRSSRSSILSSTVLQFMALSLVIGRPETPEAWLYLLIVGLPLTWLALGFSSGLDAWQRRCRYSFAPWVVWFVRLALITAIFQAEVLVRPGTSWLWQQLGRGWSGVV